MTEAAALIDAHMRTSYDRQARTGAYVTRLGETIGYGDEFVAEAVDTILAAQADQAAATWSYLTAAGELSAGSPLGYDAPLDAMIGAATHNGTPLETVYRRPGKLSAELSAAGLDSDEVARRVSSEVELLASSDVAVAGRKAEQVYGDADKRITGWVRVPNAGACKFCLTIARNTYKRGELAPAHRGCHCGTRPEFADNPADVAAQGAPPKAPKAPKVSKAERAAGKAASEQADVARAAEQYGLSADEVYAARGRVDAVKLQLRNEAAEVQKRAHAQLSQADVFQLNRPAPKTGPGSVNEFGRKLRGGEYDFLEQLDKRELGRLSRGWYTDAGGSSPDQILFQMRSFGTNSVESIDEALVEYMRLNREYDAAGALRRGKLPSERAYSGQIDVDTLLPGANGDGYSVSAIFGGDEIQAAAHIASVEKDLMAREALDFLGKSAYPSHGQSPYKMAYQSWEREVRELEYGLREFPSEMPRNAKDRLAELVPEFLDDGEDYEELYAKIIDTAHRAGEEVPANAYIPWQ